MNKLDEYFDKARKEKEIIPISEIGNILSSRQKTSKNRGWSSRYRYSLFQRKGLGPAILSVTAVITLFIAILLLLRNKGRVDQEIFIPRAQKRVMHLVKNIYDGDGNSKIAVLPFGASSKPGTDVPIHLRSKFELSEDKLKLLGITFTDELVKYEGNAIGKGYIRFLVPKASAQTPFLKIEIVLLIGPTRAGVKEYSFYPWFLTDENGLQGPRYEFGGREPAGKMSNSFFLKAIDELIPVQINRSGFPKVIFWFSQTPELVSILESAAMIKEGTEEFDHGNTEDAKRTMQIEIFPTITQGDAEVVVNVLKKQRLEIALLNLSGEVIDIPVSKQNLEVGYHKFSVDLSTYQKGLYFVRVKSEPGLTTIHRLFKK